VEIYDFSGKEERMKLSISVIILTYNEEDNIRDCLQSVYDWADEMFIIDSGSTDKTLEIAKKYTDKIYEHPFENYAKQRNWAQDSLPIKNEWVFHLDADERVSSESVSELRKIFSLYLDADGFIFPRKTIFKGRFIRHGGHYPVYHLRLFRKNKGRCEQRLYDQHFIVAGKTLKINGDIINIITPDLNLWKERHKIWANSEAEEFFLNKNKKNNIKLTANLIQRRKWLRYKIYYKLPLFLRPFIYFLYRYIIRLGFLDGKQGLIFHFWQGLWYRLRVDINIYKLMKRKKCIS
jgi:glycosyltransferase involved in cell wall biosynthesis